MKNDISHEKFRSFSFERTIKVNISVMYKDKNKGKTLIENSPHHVKFTRKL